MAAEVLQNVYLKVLEGRAVFRGKSTFKTWLFSVIRFTVLDMHRFKKLRLMRRDKYMQTPKEPLSEGPEYDIHLSNIRHTMAKLPGRQMEVLELSFYHDLTLEQIAEVLHISIGSVRQHYDRGKKKVRALLLNKSAINDE